MRSVNCWVVTVSDTRTAETDSSGRLIRERLKAAGHSVLNYAIVSDELAEIRKLLEEAREDKEVQVVILSGGTGVSSRDTTYEAVIALFDKEIRGFGELFRYLSYEQVGPFAMLSRATAGLMERKLIFSLPGSLDAVRLAMERLILPVLGHAACEIIK